MVDGIKLPDDIMADILVDFPIKALFQLLCVSKSWYSFITSPFFIMAYYYHQKTSSSPRYYYLTIYDHVGPPPRRVLRFHDQDFNFFKDVDYPVPFSMHSQLVGRSHNGLVCLSNIPSSNLTIWNPSIQKVRHLPKSKIVSGYIDQAAVSVSTGFGFQPKNDDYIVVRIAYFIKDKRFKAEIYSLSTGTWKKIKKNAEKALESIQLLTGSQVFEWVNGVGYWIVAKSNNSQVKKILSFDAGNEEVFQEIPLPADCPSGRCQLSLGNLVGSLVLVCKVATPAQQVWVLSDSNDGRGTKQYSWREHGAAHSDRTLVPSQKGMLLSSCGSSSERARLLASRQQISPMDTYDESLLLLDDCHDRFLESWRFPLRMIRNRFRRRG